MSQTLFELFSNDPVDFHLKHLKTQIFMVLISLIREKGMNQAEAARLLKVSQPRMSNLFKGYLEKFSIDTLLEMLVRLGYKVEASYDPENRAKPMVMSLCRSAF